MVISMTSRTSIGQKSRNGFGSHSTVRTSLLPVAVADLAELAATKPRGGVATALRWDRLTPEYFERLLFCLTAEEGNDYENPEWLMKTNASDAGRDLSVWRVTTDQLAGTLRSRVIVQCRHWLSRSVNLPDIATLREQMKLWEPP